MPSGKEVAQHHDGGAGGRPGQRPRGGVRVAQRGRSAGGSAGAALRRERGAGPGGLCAGGPGDGDLRGESLSAPYAPWLS